VKLFISWSKDPSHAIALALRDWIPQVIQLVEAFVSSEDIAKGTRGSEKITKELAGTDQGVICLTRQNLREPWLYFEAGALSKEATSSDPRVRTVLFDLRPSDITGPLWDYQHSIITDKAEMSKFLESVNEKCNPPLKDVQLQRAFEKYWPDLVSEVDTIRKDFNAKAEQSQPEQSQQDKPRDPAEVAEETLERVRALAKSQEDLYRLVIRTLRANEYKIRGDNVGTIHVGQPPPDAPYAVIPELGLARVLARLDSGAVEFELFGKGRGRVLIPQGEKLATVLYFTKLIDAQAFDEEWDEQRRVEEQEKADMLAQQGESLTDSDPDVLDY
jgi:hypothetical protein